MYEQIVINKVEGKARDSSCVNGNPTSFDEVMEVLNATFGDKKDMAAYQTSVQKKLHTIWSVWQEKNTCIVTIGRI